MPKDKSRISKMEIAQEKITSLLEEEVGKEMNQKEIIDSLKNVVGESTIKGALGLLEEEGQIKSKPGAGNSKYYSLEQ
jgi:predicted transcriptional regulator